MTNPLRERRKPEDEELERKRAELAELQSELIERELVVTNLKAELANFQSIYMKKVGAYYAELDKVEAEVAELLSQARPSDEEARINASHARAKATESISDYEQVVASRSHAFTPSRELKSLYREVARRIHPDLATNPADRARRQTLMAEANRAYEMGDENRLKAILSEYEDSAESISGEGPGPDLIRTIRKIAQVKKRLTDIEAEIRQINASDLFVLREKMLESEKEGRDLLEEMAEPIKVRVTRARQQLDSLRKAG